MGNALEVRGLTKKYRGFTLDNVDITLPSGCIMGFIGENGAGKSTTIKLIMDLARRDGGTVSVLGTENIGENKALKEHIGVVMEESGFPENLTLGDVSGIMGSCYRTWREETFARYAEKFSLPNKKPIKEYSRGMKMKLSIAVALSHDSRLLILDEATSGLDPIVREEILDVFLTFIQDESHSIFISSHIISDLEKICDYITFIHQGRIVFSEAKDDLLEKYVVIKCPESVYEAMDKQAVVGVRRHKFGVEALALRSGVGPGVTRDVATIEDIMLYFVKEAI